ncbi:hypothetical protein GYB61_09010 [bacterium]|nr:hypothetical protein [bacterium]
MVVDTPETLSDAIVTALDGGRRKAVVFSDLLEHRVYDREAVVNAIRQLAMRHERVRINILLRRSGRVMKGGDHGIVDLARRLPSRISVLQADSIACEDDREWLVVDDQACVLRAQSSRYDAVCRDDDPAMARRLRALFDRYWAQGQPAPELAQLSL